MRPVSEWRLFLDRLLLWSGSVALAAAVIFFVAHNWDQLGKLGKFGLLQGLVLAAILGYWRLGVDRPAGKAALLAASVMLGALLALFGQTYQTGADTWELFATWAALMLPWALAGQFAALWIFWAAVVNVALALYFRTRWASLDSVEVFFMLADARQMWVIFVFNTAALAVLDLAAVRFAWLRERWAPRLLALAGGVAITALALHAIFERRDAEVTQVVLYPLWVASLYLAYRKARPDLFMLAGACLSLIIVITALLAKQLTHGPADAFSLLFLAVAVIAMAGGSGWWLRQVARETVT